MVERFTVLEGELTVKRDGQTSILREGETGTAEAGVWHDWWNHPSRHRSPGRTVLVRAPDLV